MYKYFHLVASFLFLLALACQSPKEKETVSLALDFEDHYFPEAHISNVDFNQIPLARISDYGLFSGLTTNLEPNEGVLIYEPASSLFTDYAHKSRFIWIPEGIHVEIKNDLEGTMEFPDRTIIAKNFFYPVDFRNPDGQKILVETRLMVKRNGIWEAFPYLWEEDHSDAKYKMVGAEREVSWIDLRGNERVIQYLVPNKNQCKSCHNANEVMVPIGLKAKHLNHEMAYSPEETKNQLIKWESSGFVKLEKAVQDYPHMIDYHDSSEELLLRAMAYLDINCAHCHREEGPANTSGLFLTYEERDPMKIGIFKTPVAAGIGAGSFKFAIYPGKPDESIMTHRMASDKVAVAMPEIGRVIAHEEGLTLIKEWIKSLDEKDYSFGRR